MPLDEPESVLGDGDARGGAAHTWNMVPADVHVKDANVAALLTFSQVQVPG